MIIDTHTHLYVEQFNEDRSEVILRAIESGVQKLLLPNIDSSTIDPMLKLVDEFPDNCYPMIGLHPGNVGDDYQEELSKMRERIDRPNNFIAIGEIGMDLYWDKTYIEEQRIAFRTQIGWAKEFGLPIVIHARDAFEEIFRILDEENSVELKGVFHCFTGGVKEAEHILSYGGFKLGIGGVVTYKKSELPEVLKEIPLDNILLETDSPYLPPVPFRGKRNESSYINYVADKLVDVYGVSRQDIERITSKNADELFRLTEQSTKTTIG